MAALPEQRNPKLSPEQMLDSPLRDAATSLAEELTNLEIQGYYADEPDGLRLHNAAKARWSEPAKPKRSVTALYPANYAPPTELHAAADSEYRQWSDLAAQGGHLGFPWGPIHNIVGPLYPGWLVLVGARAKGGKSTFLRAVFDSWITNFQKRILFVGTEQNAGLLRALWACLRLRLPSDAAIDPSHPEHAKVRDDVSKQGEVAGQAIVVAEPAITIDAFTRWARVAYQEKCEVLMLDHFHRLEDTGDSQHRSRNAAIREIKNIAAKSNMLVLVAAQLKNGSDETLGEYEVPGSQSWAETAGLRRECDVAVQVWRPFVPGVTRQQKVEARDDPTKLTEVVQPNVMALRCDAHRYRDVAPYRAARLTVNQGELSSWGMP